jgi:hypothetical protein
VIVPPETNRLDEEKSIRLTYPAFDNFREKHKQLSQQMADEQGGNDMDNDNDFGNTSKDEGLGEETGIDEQALVEEPPQKPVELSTQETAKILDPKGSDIASLGDRIKEMMTVRHITYVLPQGTPILEGGELKPLTTPLPVMIKDRLVICRGQFVAADGKRAELSTETIAKAILNPKNAVNESPFESTTQVVSTDLAVAEFPCYKVGASPGSALSRFLSVVTVVGSHATMAKDNSTLLGGIVVVPGECLNGEPKDAQFGVGPGLAEPPVDITTPKGLGSLAVVLVRDGDEWIAKMVAVRAAMVTADDLLAQYGQLKNIAAPAHKAIITGLEQLLTAAGAEKTKKLRVFRYDLLSIEEKAVYSKYLGKDEAGKTVIDKVVYRSSDFGNAVAVHMRMKSTYVAAKTTGQFVVDIVIPRAPIVPYEVVRSWCIDGRVKAGKVRAKTARVEYDDKPVIEKLFASLYTGVEMVAATASAAPVVAPPTVTPASPPPKRTKQTGAPHTPAAAAATVPPPVITVTPAAPVAVAAPVKVEPAKTPIPTAPSDETQMLIDASTDDAAGKFTIAAAAPTEGAATPAPTGRKRTNSKSNAAAAVAPTSAVAAAVPNGTAEPAAKKSKGKAAGTAPAPPPTAVAALKMPEGPPKTLQGSVFGMLERASKHFCIGGKGKESLMGAFQKCGPGALVEEESKEQRDQTASTAKTINVFGPMVAAQILQIIASAAAATEIAAAPPVDEADAAADDDNW